MTETTVPRYASPVDYDAYGLYGPGRGFNQGTSFQRPVYRFQGRITANGSSGYPAVADRYHLYISWAARGPSAPGRAAPGRLGRAGRDDLG